MARSARRAGELCASLADDVIDDDNDDNDGGERMERALPPSVSVQLAHAYFGQRQYARAAAHLRNTNERSPLALFMRIYASLLVGRKARHVTSSTLTSSSGHPAPEGGRVLRGVK